MISIYTIISPKSGGARKEIDVLCWKECDADKNPVAKAEFSSETAS